MTSYKGSTRSPTNKQTNKIEMEAKVGTGKDEAEKQSFTNHVS